MLKVTTRLFAAGVLATTLTAVNTDAFAAESKSGMGECCMKGASAMVHKDSVAKGSAKAASAKTVAAKASCCQKPAATKVASAAAVKGKAVSSAPSCCQKPEAVKATTKTVAKKALKS